jgi:hypothetical protein
MQVKRDNLLSYLWIALESIKERDGQRPDGSSFFVSTQQAALEETIKAVKQGERIEVVE